MSGGCPATQLATTPPGLHEPTISCHSAKVPYRPTSLPDAASWSSSACSALRLRSTRPLSQLFDDSTSTQIITAPVAPAARMAATEYSASEQPIAYADRTSADGSCSSARDRQSGVVLAALSAL